MNLVKRAKILASTLTLFFALCSIMGFSVANKFKKDDFKIYSYFFGINGICLFIFASQVLYRFCTMNEIHVKENNKECFTCLTKLMSSTLNNSDYQFQKIICSILTITHCYCSLSLVFTQLKLLAKCWGESDLFPDLEECDWLRSIIGKIYGGQSQFNSLFYMEVLSIPFGAYLQTTIIIKIFYEIFDNHKNHVLNINNNLKTEEQFSQKFSIVFQAMIYVTIWICLFFVRFGVYIYISIVTSGSIQALSIFLFSQSICFIIYCILLFLQLISVKNQLIQQQKYPINNYEKYFLGWFSLISSLIYAKQIRISSIFCLLLLFTQSIFGLIALNSEQIIYTLNNKEYLKQNLLYVDTLSVTILFCIQLLRFLLTFLFKKTNPLPQGYNFEEMIIRETDIHPRPAFNDENNQQYEKTPGENEKF